MKRVLLVLLLVTLYACAPASTTTMPAPAAVSSLSPSVISTDSLTPFSTPTREPTAEPLYEPNTIPLPPAGHLYHGVYPGGYTSEESDLTLYDLRSYEEAAGKKAVWVYFSHNWYEGRAFPLQTAAWIREAGSIPYIRLMLRSSAEQGVAEPVFTLQAIIDGQFDSDLQVWCAAARDFGTPLLAEYGTEVNGEWFSWNGIWNGAGETAGYGDPNQPDGPERFRDAYRHIIQTCRDEGAENITWVFHLNASDSPQEGWNAFENYYPGDDYIDWIGISNYGAQTPQDDYCDQFRLEMDTVYPRVDALTADKPIFIAEFGVTKGNPYCDQAEWARAALTDITSFRWPRIIAFSWWNEWWQNDDDPAHDTTMRLQDNPALAAIFQQLVGNNPIVLEQVHPSNEQTVFLPMVASEFSNPTTIAYTPSSADIPNPERGFFGEVAFEEQDLTWYVEMSGNTLARLPARLDAYRDRDLPPEYLNALNAYFNLARGAGLKLIVRFSYSDGPYPNPEPDAPLEQVLRHIQQLAPVLEANKDVIAWFEAGFIGAWGEWHSSTHGLDTPENRLIIRDALMAYFPADRFILFRYPGDFIGWYPQPLTEAQAFAQTDQARIGHHNDCFLASDDDEGTYLDGDGVNHINRWQRYIARMTRFAPMSGETCALNPPRSDCPTALQEMKLLHWSAINEEWHPDVVQAWKDQGCYDEIRRRLGYRLTLIEAAYQSKVRAGSELQVRVSLQNTGFASPLLARPVYLVITRQDFILAYPVNTDPRRWEPGEHDITATLSLPTDLPSGIYQLALWLPDPAPNLRSDPRYAIRFANESIWDTTKGWNVLGEIEIIGISD